VRGPQGEVISGAEVIIRNKDTGAMTTTVTDELGRFSKSGLIPGSYSVTVSVHGFAVTQRDIELKIGSALQLDIPVGTSSGPSLAGGASHPKSPTASPPNAQTGSGPGVISNQSSTSQITDVIDKSFDRDIELLDWLNSMKNQRKRLFRVIPGADKASLFVFEKVKAGTNFDYTVILVNEAPDPKSLLLRINQYIKKTFIGIHRLSNNSYLMVFYG